MCISKDHNVSMEDGTGDINGNMEMDIYTEEEVNTTNDEDRMEDEN